MIRLFQILSPALLVLLLLQPLSAAEAKEPKRVLILYSEDKAHPAHELTDQGIRTAFLSNKRFNVQLYTEYLDLSRFSGSAHVHTMADYLNHKYAGTKLDAIIAVYPAAMDFLMHEEGKVFPEVPIVACEIIRDTAENLDRSPWRRVTTGVIIGDNAASVLENALRLRSGTRGVALVAGTAPNDAYNEFSRALQSYEGKIELIDLTRLPMMEILARVGSLPRDTIVLYSSIFRDGANQIFVPREALSLISAAANQPVFGLYDTYMGYGIVGGSLMSFEQQGREAATLTLRVLAGESPASIPFGGEQTYLNLYDWRQLKRWGISEKALPPGSLVKFKSGSMWEEHKEAILGVTSFIIVETLLIVALLVSLRKRRRAEIEAQQRRDELAHVTRVATLGELTSSIAHEINQPLAAIRNYANAAHRFLSQGEPDLSKARDALEGIVRDDRRAAEVISRVRELLKKEEHRYHPVQMNQVIQEALAFIHSDAVLEGLIIETELAPALPVVQGDRVQLQQVLLNLILNAVDAMNQSKPNSCKLVIKTENGEDRSVKISVRDFGAGIDETHRDKLFEPFFTTKPKGMGMGLAISQRIIHVHGGSIWADNNPGGGATFCFTLPTGNEG